MSTAEHTVTGWNRTLAADKASIMVGWTVLPPGARHDRHRHFNCDEFRVVVKDRRVVYTDEGEKPCGEDLVFRLDPVGSVSVRFAA